MNAEQYITVVCCILLQVTRWLTELQGDLIKPGSFYDVAVHTSGAARSLEFLAKAFMYYVFV